MKKAVLLALLMVLAAPVVKPSDTNGVTQINSWRKVGPFSEGTWLYNLNQAFSMNFRGQRYEGTPYGGLSEFDMDIEADYFLEDHWAVGARILHHRTKDRAVDEDFARDHDALLFVNGTYGTRINDAFNLLAKASIGTGMNFYRVKDSFYGTDEKSSSHYFVFDLGIASPIELAEHLFLTPAVGYRFSTESDSDYAIREHGAYFGLNMDLFFDCDDFFADHKNKFREPSDRYEAGTWLVGGQVGGRLDFGGRKYTFTGYTDQYLFGFNEFSLSGGVFRYFRDNMAAGAQVIIEHSAEKDRDSSAEEAENRFVFMPMFRLNIPHEDPRLNNTYVQTGIGIGATGSKEAVDFDLEYKEKFRTFVFEVGVGYNFFINRRTILSPAIFYTNTTKNHQDENRENLSGIVMGIGWYVRL